MNDHETKEQEQTGVYKEFTRSTLGDLLPDLEQALVGAFLQPECSSRPYGESI